MAGLRLSRSVAGALATALLLSGLVALPARAGSNGPWATVNICDTARHPNTIGLRAAVPGDGKHHSMWVRLTVQFASGGSWKALANGGRTGFIAAGSSLKRSRQVGASFHFAPASGTTYTLRGVAEFEWRQGKRVVKHARATTKSGVAGVSGGDPAGYSASTCEIF